MNHDSRRLGIPSRFRLFGTRSSVPTHSFGFALRENIDLGRELCLKLEPVLGPDPLYARVADAHLLGHSPHAPVRGGGRVLLHGLLDDLEFDRSADRLLAGRLGAALDETPDAGLDEILLPAPDGCFRNSGLAHDR